MRGRFLNLAAVLAAILAIGSCGDGWVIRGCNPGMDCRFESYVDIANPNATYRAVAGTRACTYRGKPAFNSVEVKIIRGNGTTADQGASDGEPNGETVFDSFQAPTTDAHAVTASNIALSWRGSSELVITHPADMRFSCQPPLTGTIRVHCIERGFESSAK